jgi:hypothetical protein
VLGRLHGVGRLLLDLDQLLLDLLGLSLDVLDDGLCRARMATRATTMTIVLTPSTA